MGDNPSLFSYSQITCAPHPSPAPVPFSRFTPAPQCLSCSEEPKTDHGIWGVTSINAGYRGLVTALVLLTMNSLVQTRMPLLAHAQLTDIQLLELVPYNITVLKWKITVPKLMVIWFRGLGSLRSITKESSK